jgi:SNF2 family DNA or RNA helicase
LGTNAVLNHHLQWHRVIVDEAHQIRNKLTSESNADRKDRILSSSLGVSNAVVDLDATYRWCLTGCASHPV